MPLPIDEDTREWINVRTAWLVAEFGKDALCQKQIVLPTTDFLPARFDRSKKGLNEILDRICSLMDIDRRQVELAFYQEANSSFMASTLGMYEQTSEGKYRVWVEVTSLTDPLGVVATFAHELGHIHLLGHGRVDENEDDHEPLTDLLTVLFGFGVIMANSSLMEKHEGSGTYSLWLFGRRGYLNMQAYGYALALYAAMREETDPPWRKELRPDVRGYFDRSVVFLAEHGLPDLTRVRTTTARPQNHIVYDEGDEVEIPVGVCTYCGEETGDVDVDVCDECRESIEVNEQEIIREQLKEERSSRWYEKFYKIGCLLIIAFFIVLLVMEFLSNRL